MVLVGAGLAAPAQQPSEKERQRCKALNDHILQRALVSMDLHHMVSPVTGGGINMPHMAQLFVRAVRDGCPDADALANDAWSFLDSIGERLLKDGKRVESRDDNFRMLRVSAQSFLTVARPLLEGLEILPRDSKPVRIAASDRR